MEIQEKQYIEQKQNYQLQFLGNGSDFFAIIIVNWFLTLITLGFYYPWARAKKLSYLYNQTTLNKERFHFSGTGKEMFIGFVKVLLFYVLILGIYAFFLIGLKNPALAVLFLYLAIFLIIPFAIHGSLRYRMSRSSYRGIRFGYRGNRKEFTLQFYKWLFFTIITFGIYGAWLVINFRRYTHQNMRFGDVEFSYNGDGGAFFLLNLKGYFLSIITLGIYTFWWESELFAYYVDHLRMKRGDQKIQCRSTATGGDFFELIVVNFLIVFFTFGIGTAWAEVRTHKFICNQIRMKGDINLNEIQQTESEYNNALGDDVLDFLDIDLG